MKAAMLTLLLATSGCVTLGENIRDEGIKAAKCITACAIRCAAKGAVEVAQCPIDGGVIKSDAIKAAQCVAKCSVGCGIKTIPDDEK